MWRRGACVWWAGGRDHVVLPFPFELKTDHFQSVLPLVRGQSPRARLHQFIEFYCTLSCSAFISPPRLNAMNGTVAITRHFVMLLCLKIRRSRDVTFLFLKSKTPSAASQTGQSCSHALSLKRLMTDTSKLGLLRGDFRTALRVRKRQ